MEGEQMVLEKGKEFEEKVKKVVISSSSPKVNQLKARIGFQIKKLMKRLWLSPRAKRKKKGKRKMVEPSQFEFEILAPYSSKAYTNEHLAKMLYEVAKKCRGEVDELLVQRSLALQLQQEQKYKDVSSEDLTPDENDRLPIIKTATKLKGVGITFEKVSNTCLPDVKFEKEEYLNRLICFGFLQKRLKARLLIPELRVDYSIESVLRNLMVFEQYSYSKHHYVSSYVALIGYLIHSKEDVDVMVEDKVITHDLGSDKELAQLINILCKNTVLNSTCYGTVSNRLNTHYDSQYNKTLALLSSVYFPDLLRGTATVAAIIVVVFAITNFVKIVRDFAHPK
ncbi:uncharacterized protein LOC129289976 [Prosopis cineraria]|uniref:uncharacterized protein LOC129289976 n=1 Tax=Prosopis cineraria TaxID=364024 RepID=UPI00240F2E45|nr:uncharacterized protein LOC129289976 [Prosopis cineraria]